MKIRIHFTLLLLTFFLASSAQTASRTFTKSFNTDGRGKIVLDLPGNIDVKIWEGPALRFEIAVNLPSGNGSMLNELANIGRYNLTAKSEGDALIVTAPNLQKLLRIKGEVLKEDLTFVVFVPKDLDIELPNAATASADLRK